MTIDYGEREMSGFMIYASDWLSYTEDYTSEEIGEMVKALLRYFLYGEYIEFPDRGMRQFYKQGIKAIELDRDRYEKKCLRNAYNRYRGLCKDRNETPLDYEEWLTTVNDRPRPSTMVTNTNTNNSINTNNQESIPIINTNDQESEIKRKRFVKPSIDEIRAYCNERNNGIDPEAFFDHYESNGWKIGKSSVKDWKACVRNWERNSYDRKQDNTDRSVEDKRSGDLGSIRIMEL